MVVHQSIAYLVPPNKYDHISPFFFDGRRSVDIGEKQDIDYYRGGKLRFIDEQIHFQNGKIKVKKDSREFFIDKTGKEIKENED